MPASNPLEYPLDVDYILRKKRLIRRDLLLKNKGQNLVDLKLAIIGGSTTSEIRDILEIFLLEFGISAKFYESEYGKYYEDSTLGNDTLEEFNPDVVYVHTTNQNVLTYPDINCNENDVEDLLQTEIERYRVIWESLSRFNCSIIQNNLDLPYFRSLGNLDGCIASGKSMFINRLNLMLANESRKTHNLYINDINYLSSRIGLDVWFDPSLWYHAKYAVSLSAIPELAFNIGKIVRSIMGRTKKCLALDLDNTCWGGVIGDDGLKGISIGHSDAISEAHYFFQKYVKELKDTGVALAVCSKNDLENAEEGFSHPDSVLHVEDFTSFKANWDPKHQNILAIAKEVNVGLDSIVFMDDNPVERDLILSQIPSVSTPDIGSSIDQFIHHIDRNGYFETSSLSIDDVNRNQYYLENKQRLRESQTFDSYDDFLTSLNMSAEIESFLDIYVERIAQLTNKTNQFNLTTKRYTVAEIEAILLDDSYIKIYGRLSDKYGDNGLVAASVGKIDGSSCHIDLWLMSCRVLKRGMEFAMMDKFVEKCLQRNIEEVVGYYYSSQKNQMVSELYGQFGFKLVEVNNGNTVWKLRLSQYKSKNKFISYK